MNPLAVKKTSRTIALLVLMMMGVCWRLRAEVTPVTSAAQPDQTFQRKLLLCLMAVLLVSARFYLKWGRQKSTGTLDSRSADGKTPKR